jgi:hypothetical protein
VKTGNTSSSAHPSPLPKERELVVTKTPPSEPFVVEGEGVRRPSPENRLGSGT